MQQAAEALRNGLDLEPSERLVPFTFSGPKLAIRPEPGAR